MNKKDLSKRDIGTKFISPAVKQTGWNEISQFREKCGFTKGRLIVRGKLVSREKGKPADYILNFEPNIPIAIIEGKDNTHNVGNGIQQALKNVVTLYIPFALSSDGEVFIFMTEQVLG